MSTSTTRLGLTKPAAGEQYSRATTNANSDIVDDFAIEYDDFVSKAPKGLMKESRDNTTSTGLAGTGVMCNKVIADLVAGRWYTVRYKVSTTTTAVDMAIVIDFKKSITTDNGNTGTSLSESMTFYSAPAASQGYAVEYSATWEATATETVNIKAIMARATGSAGYDISKRHIMLWDEGMQL